MQYNSVIMAISKFYKTMMLIYMWGFFFLLVKDISIRNYWQETFEQFWCLCLILYEIYFSKLKYATNCQNQRDKALENRIWSNSLTEGQYSKFHRFLTFYKCFDNF